MKQYLIDEIRPGEHAALKSYLDDHFKDDNWDGIYWLPLDDAILTEVQTEHTACRPFYFALELSSAGLACELLVRTRHRVRCDCIGYATERQRNWLIDCVDAIFEKLQIKT